MVSLDQPRTPSQPEPSVKYISVYLHIFAPTCIMRVPEAAKADEENTLVITRGTQIEPRATSSSGLNGGRTRGEGKRGRRVKLAGTNGKMRLRAARIRSGVGTFPLRICNCSPRTK